MLRSLHRTRRPLILVNYLLLVLLRAFFLARSLTSSSSSSSSLSFKLLLLLNLNLQRIVHLGLLQDVLLPHFVQILAFLISLVTAHTLVHF